MTCDITKCGYHIPTTINYIGKPDSISAECVCGKSIRVGLWWDDPPPGWFSYDWKQFIVGIKQFTSSHIEK